MASYSVAFKPSVRKDLRRLSRATVKRVLARIEELAEDPLPKRVIKLSGADHFYRIRVGNYRIVYELEAETHQIIIHYVRHRREVYRDL